MDILGGWQIDDDLGIYRIPIRITHPETKISIVKYCLYDTGFSGYLGLDSETISLLNLPKVGRGKGLTIKGLVEYDNYQGTIDIVDQEQKTIVSITNKEADNSEFGSIIPIQDFGIALIGLRAIRQFSWMILSDRAALFLIK